MRIITRFGVRCPAFWGGLLLLGLGGGACPVSAQEKPPEKLLEKASEKKPRPAHALLAQMQNELSEVADSVLPAVVTVFSVKAGGPVDRNGESPFGRGTRRSSGSGFLIRPDGWILTNDHVVFDADRVRVRLQDGREFRGSVYRDPRSDLALIKITADTPLPVLPLGDSDKVKVGYWAIAVGSPFHYEGTFSFGIISNLSRRQEIGDPNLSEVQRVYQNMIQTDAAINPGNSGGPLCNLEGEVIAINTAIESDKGVGVGIGFAIPINSAKFVIDELIANGRVRYGYLGLSSVTAATQLASNAKTMDGALINEEPPTDAPAYKAGVRAGDTVIALNEIPVHTEADLRRVAGQARPGTSLRIKLLRKGHEMQFSATVAEAPPVKFGAGKAGFPKNRIGLDVETLTEELAKRYRIEKCAGVVVRSIDPVSEAADKEDITEGIVILRVNNTDTPTRQAYLEAIAALKPGSQVQLLCQLDKNRKVIVLPVD